MPRLGLYQPFVEDRNVRRLYQLKLEHRRRTGRTVPMTALINRILDDFFTAEGADVTRGDAAIPNDGTAAPPAVPQ